MAYNKKELHDSFKSIIIEGFLLKKEIMGFSWRKEYPNRIERIIIGYAGYPDSYRIYSPFATIYFYEVESIIEKFKKLYFPDRHYGNNTIHSSFIKLEKLDYSKFQEEINSESSFREVAIEIYKIINNGALPFFDSYSNLNHVFEETEKMPIEEMADFIEQPLPQRRIVIKWLCKDKKYQEYVDMVIDYYKSEKDDSWKEIELLDKFLKTMI